MGYYIACVQKKPPKNDNLKKWIEYGQLSTVTPLLHQQYHVLFITEFNLNK